MQITPLLVISLRIHQIRLLDKIREKLMKHMGVVLSLFQSISDYSEAADLIMVFITAIALGR